MWELFRTSTFRLAVLYFGLFAISVFALLAFIYWQTVVYSDRQTGETIDAEIAGLAEQYRQAGLSGLVQVIGERSNPARGATMLYLLTDAAGAPLAGNLTQWPSASIDPDGWMRFGLQTAPAPGRPPERHVVQATSFLLVGGFQLLVGRDLAERDRFRDRLTTSLGWSAGLMLCFGLVGGVLMSRTVLGRIEAINRTSARIMAGEIAQRIPLHGNDDEFDRLAFNLNTMLDRIERLMDSIRQVTDNIAHDLRSPLGRLRARIEVALLDPPSTERYRAELERTIEEADQLLATFTALLEIAGAESGTMRVPMAPLDLAALAGDLAELYEPAAEERGLQFSVEAGPGPIHRSGDRHLLARALVNLIENALKYTPPGGSVRLGVTATATSACLTVADTGPGIPLEARERVFDRFYRLESSRTTEGNGLGLSLVRAVIRLHGGTVVLGEERPGAPMPGLRVDIVLPIQPLPGEPP